MDASIDRGSPLKPVSPGRFTRVSVQTPAGEIEARLSEHGNWELRVRRDQEASWRLACSGDLDCGAVTAQPDAHGDEPIVRGVLSIDPAARKVTVSGAELPLARKEFALLLVLAVQPDRVFSKEELLATIWGYAGLSKSRTLESHAHKLRGKLARAGAEGLIVNCWAVGYRLWDRTDLTTFPPLRPAGEAA